MQVFTRSQRRWVSPRLLKRDVRRYIAEVDRLEISPVLAHASYLINLAASNADTRRKSLQSFTDELRRARILGIDVLVVHPGAHVGAGMEAGIAQAAASIDRCLRRFDHGGPAIALETTAGQGSVIGSEFSQIRDIIGSSSFPGRLGVCLDSCHLHAAGYDIRSEDSYEAVLEELDIVIGLNQVLAWHLNDSLRELGSKKDRHADLGRGTLGLVPLRRVAQDSRFVDIAACLETPGGPERWAEELLLLRSHHQPSLAQMEPQELDCKKSAEQ